MSLIEQIEELKNSTAEQTLASQALAKDVAGMIGNINNELERKKQDVDNFINKSALSLIRRTSLRITANYAEMTKNELITEVGINESDTTKTKWLKIADAMRTATFNRPFFLEGTAYSASPGYYESPQFNNDKSRAFAEMLLAPDNLTEDEINSIYNEDNACRFGAWDYRAVNSIGYTLSHTGKSGSALYVRFINRGHQEGVTPQEISTFGGNSNFKLKEAFFFHELEILGD